MGYLLTDWTLHRKRIWSLMKPINNLEVYMKKAVVLLLAVAMVLSATTLFAAGQQGGGETTAGGRKILDIYDRWFGVFAKQRSTAFDAMIQLGAIPE